MNTTTSKVKKQVPEKNDLGAPKDIMNSNIVRKVLRMEEVLDNVFGPAK